MTIRVGLVEDNNELRKSLVELLNSAPGFTCTGAYSDGKKALEALRLLTPDVLLVDLELPGMSGSDLIAEVKAKWPKVEILVLTIHDEPEFIFGALEAGASGYLVKTTSDSELLQAITDVVRGCSPMSGPIARLVIRAFHRRNKNRRELAQLSVRESEILKLLANGLRYKEIADQLGISTRTVNTHLNTIYRKLHVNSRAEAAAKYFDAT